MDSLRKPEGVVPLTPALAEDFASRLSPEHAREIRELSGLAPEAALRLSLAASLLAYAVRDRAGETLFLIGVEPAGCVTGAAQVWMVAARGMEAHARTILRCARWGLAAAFLATGAARLEQYIPVWYETGLRFAFRLGFRPGGAGTASGENNTVHIVMEKEDAWAFPRSAVF